MDQSSLENKLSELVREVGGVTDPQYQKLAMLAKQADTPGYKYFHGFLPIIVRS